MTWRGAGCYDEVPGRAAVVAAALTAGLLPLLLMMMGVVMVGAEMTVMS